MAIEVSVRAEYAEDPDVVFAQACQFSEMAEAMKGLATYDGLPDEPAQQGQTYVVDVTLWKIFKTKGHTMYVETLDRPNRIIQSREHNPNVARWDHRLTVEPHTTGSLWHDCVVIDAGWQTWGTSRFAAYVYKRRHLLRQALSITTQFRRV